MKRALLLLSCVMACGGGNASTQTTTPATQASGTQAAASDTTAATATPPDDSPEAIGNRHKKINGWFLSGGGKDFYDAIYEPGSEPVIVVKQKSEPSGRWVTLMKNVGAAPYAGKKIRIRVGVKTSNMPIHGIARAELWARSASPHQAEDAPSTKVPLDHNAEMKTYEVTIDVKDNARVVEYGASIVGDGELRIGRDAIDVL